MDRQNTFNLEEAADLLSTRGLPTTCTSLMCSATAGDVSVLTWGLDGTPLFSLEALEDHLCAWVPWYERDTPSSVKSLSFEEWWTLHRIGSRTHESIARKAWEAGQAAQRGKRTTRVV